VPLVDGIRVRKVKSKPFLDTVSALLSYCSATTLIPSPVSTLLRLTYRVTNYSHPPQGYQYRSQTLFENAQQGIAATNYASCFNNPVDGCVVRSCLLRLPLMLLWQLLWSDVLFLVCLSRQRQTRSLEGSRWVPSPAVYLSHHQHPYADPAFGEYITSPRRRSPRRG
jgi:hypothetical protein